MFTNCRYTIHWVSAGYKSYVTKRYIGKGTEGSPHLSSFESPFSKWIWPQKSDEISLISKKMTHLWESKKKQPAIIANKNWMMLDWSAFYLGGFNLFPILSLHVRLPSISSTLLAGKGSILPSIYPPGNWHIRPSEKGKAYTHLEFWADMIVPGTVI